MKSRIVRSIALVMLLIVMVILPVMATGCGQTTTTTAKTLTVGMMTPSTGPAADKGLAGKNGIIDAVRYINEELGGVDGSGTIRIRAVYRDSGYQQPTAVNIINEFMEKHCLMFMTHSSTEMSYVKDIANEHGFPGLVSYASQSNYHPPEHIYGQAPDYGDDFVTFVKYYMQHMWNQTGTETGQPKVVVLGLSNPTGQGAYDGARAVADELGFELLPYETHTSTTLSEVESLTRVRGENPDLIFISSTPAPSSVIMRNLNDLGMYPKDGVTVAMAHASFTEQIVSMAGASKVEGVYGVFPTATWSDNFESVNKAKEYAAEYNPQNVGSADYLSTWTTMMIMREILKTALDNGVSYDTLAKGDAEAWKAVEEQGIQKLDHVDLGGLQKEVTYTPGDNRLDKFMKIYQITSGTITMVPGTDWVEAPLIKYEEIGWWVDQYLD